MTKKSQVAIAIFAALALVVVPELLVQSRFLISGDLTKLSSAEYVSAVIEERRTVIAVLAALGAGVSLLYTHRRHELEQDRNRTDRFNTAVEHLGDSTTAVQLGGIYALERVGVDSERDAVAVTQILSTFVRSSQLSKREPLEPSGELKKRHDLYPTEAQAALDVLCRHPEWHSQDRRLDLRGANLADASLIDANLRYARINDADLSAAILYRADLRQAAMFYTNLAGASFQRSNISRANLTGADLTKANLAESCLIRTDLTKAHLIRTKLTKANLTNAVLSGADLTKANLTGANLTGADLTEANLTGANLTGADLTDTKLTDADLTGVNFTNADLLNTDLTTARNVPRQNEEGE